jgi:hypothetical protein
MTDQTPNDDSYQPNIKVVLANIESGIEFYKRKCNEIMNILYELCSEHEKIDNDREMCKSILKTMKTIKDFTGREWYLNEDGI